MHIYRRFVLNALLALLPSGIAIAQSPAGTAFTYQGELASAGTPATGAYDIRFRLFDSAAGGTQIGSTLCSDNLAITSGRIATTLDFGPAAFTGQKRFLEIEARQDSGLDCADASGYTVLSPRQELTATPTATFAQSAGAAATALTASNAISLNGQPASFFSNAANLTGTLPSASLSGAYTRPLTLSNPTNIFAGRGAAITNLSATNISTGVLDAARMPANWAAGGDLDGFFPSPTIKTGAITLSRLAPGVQNVLSKLTNQTAQAPLDAVAWGYNVFTQLNIPALPPSLSYTAAAGGAFHSLALRSDGLVVACGDNSTGQTNVLALPPGLTYTAVAGGVLHSVALRSDGTAVAWGSNVFGEADVPALPQGLTYTAVAAGGFNSLALRSDGQVIAWGRNEYDQLNVPVLPPGATYTAIACGDYHGLALRSDGRIVGWGRNNYGQIDVPALPPGITYTKVAAGSLHSLALRIDGTAVAWGYSDYGQTNVPPLDPGLTYTALAGGVLHSLGLRSDGTVAAWGGNDNGQTTVLALPAGVGYSSVAAGAYHSLATRSIPVSSLGSTVGLNIGSNTPPPANGGISVAGASSFAAGVSAASFSGSGADLTNLRASSITGVLGAAQIPNLDASKITSGTLAAPQIPNLDASKITSGTLAAAQIPNLDASKITSGTLAAALIPNLDASKITTGTLAITRIPDLDAAKIATGTLADGRLSTNIPRISTNNSFTGALHSFAGKVAINTPPGLLELDINGRINVAQGVIQRGGAAITATTDLGLYSQTAGAWVRFVTNNAQFVWYSDSGAGTTPRMTLSPAGNLAVTGSLAKAGGSFKIDHPLDPENKYLYHSFVESPDMMNVYNGNVVTDANGYATITLPDYFEALNRDFRYQLTVVDDNAPDVHFVRVASKVGAVSLNRFMIKSTPGNLEVSWQVTGIRRDAWAEKNRIPNTVDKPAAEKGTLLHPEAFGKSSRNDNP